MSNAPMLRGAYGLLMAIGLAGAGVASAYAQETAAEYPSRPITIVVPYAPGGGTDAVARLLAPKLQDALGQPVVVENREGAGSRLGLAHVARSEPDGYTLLYSANGGFAITPHIGESPYDPVTDFQPITMISQSVYVIAANPDFEPDNLSELIEYAKANPGVVNYGSSGAGGQGHVAGEMLKQMAGIDMVHIPFGGTGESNTAVISGTVDLTWAGLSGIMPQVEAGRVKALGVTGLERVSALPDVPSAAEAVPGYETTIWYALFAPAGTPEDIVAKIRDAAIEAANDESVRGAIEGDGAQVTTNTPEEMAAVIQADYEKYGEIIGGLDLE